MSENKYVLACINGYPPSQSVIDYGAWFSTSMSQGLKLFHSIDTQHHESTSDLSGSIGLGAREEILEEIVSIEHEQNKLLQKKSKIILDSGKSHAEEMGATDIKICSRKGRVLDNILDFKDDLSVAVIGKYGKKHQGMSAEERPVGHKVEALIKNLDLPVMVVTEEFTQPKSVLLSYDGSKGAKKILNFLCDRFKGSKLDIEVIHFGEETEENTSVLNEALELLKTSSLNATGSIIDGEAEEDLLPHFEKSGHDILAMGAFGHGAFHDFFLGSLTSKVIRDSKKPVLLVR